LAGIPLKGAGIVYIVDRAGCTQQAFQQMLDACYGSIKSLGQGRKFALIIWNNYQDLAFPPLDLAVASVTNMDECRKVVVDTSAGSTDIGAILVRAIAGKPEDIVLVSAVDIDDPKAMAIRDALAKAQGTVRFHAIAIGADLTAQRLRPLVADFAGQFKQLDLAALK